jgi:hypothetical protein
MKKIAILDFANIGIYVLDFDEDVFNNEEIQDFFDKANETYGLGLKESQCQWMIYEPGAVEIAIL